MRIGATTACTGWGRVSAFKGKVYSGYNQNRTKMFSWRSYSVHAEVHAIHQYLKLKSPSKRPKIFAHTIPSSAVMYVARIASGIKPFAKSKPCDHCLRTIQSFGVRTIKYTDIIDNELVICTIKI
jgi:deoxycytidylate deaminase